MRMTDKERRAAVRLVIVSPHRTHIHIYMTDE